MKEEEWGEATDSFDDVIIVLIHLMTPSLFWFTRCEKESRERKNWGNKEEGKEIRREGMKKGKEVRKKRREERKGRQRQGQEED